MDQLVQVEKVQDLATAGMDAAINRFLLSLDATERTRGTYRKALKRFTAWIVEEGITRPPLREDILAYRASLAAEGKTAYTISAYLAAVRRFFSYLESEGICPNVAKGIKGPKKPSLSFRVTR